MHDQLVAGITRSWVEGHDDCREGLATGHRAQRAEDGPLVRRRDESGVGGKHFHCGWSGGRASRRIEDPPLRVHEPHAAHPEERRGIAFEELTQEDARGGSRRRDPGSPARQLDGLFAGVDRQALEVTLQDARGRVRCREAFPEDEFGRLLDRPQAKERQHPEHHRESESDVQRDPPLQAEAAEAAAERAGSVDRVSIGHATDACVAAATRIAAARAHSSPVTSRWVTARTVRGPNANTSTPRSRARATTVAASGASGRGGTRGCSSGRWSDPARRSGARRGPPR